MRFSRVDDSPTDTVVKVARKKRNIQAWAGLAIAIGGIVFACIHPAQAYLGIGAALLGAGAIEPSHVLGLLRK